MENRIELMFNFPNQSSRPKAILQKFLPLQDKQRPRQQKQVSLWKPVFSQTQITANSITNYLTILWRYGDTLSQTLAFGID